jgi:hypothetical protein
MIYQSYYFLLKIFMNYMVHIYFSDLFFTPNIIIDAPDNVAECPPLGQGGTPSIKGVAHCHNLGSNSFP